LIKPLLLFFVEVSRLEEVAALIEEDHQGGRVRGQGKSLLVLRDGDVVKLRPGSSRNFNGHRNPKESYAAFGFLCLFDSEHHLALFGVVDVAQVEFRSARAVQPLAEELIHIDV